MIGELESRKAAMLSVKNSAGQAEGSKDGQLLK